MKKFLLFLTLALGFASCAPKNELLKANFYKQEFDDKVAFSFKRNACFGECPIDQIIISQKGEVVYFGERFSKAEGYYKANSKISLDDLLARLYQLGIKDCPEQYDGGVADLPSYQFYINYEGHQQSMHAKSDYPNEVIDMLKFLKQYIDELSLGEAIEPNAEQ